MNIIEAAKALKEGKIVFDPGGFRVCVDRGIILIHVDGSDYLSSIQNLLSEKWTVLSE